MVLRRLRDLREDNDLKVKDVAALLYVHRGTYSNYELGYRTMPLDILTKLADYYEVSVDYLLGRTNKPEIRK